MSTHTEAPKSNDLPIGTSVLAFPGSREGRAMMTTTRSVPWVLPSGDIVVLVEGYAGGIALTHIEVVPTPPAPESATDPSACVEGGGGL